MKKIELLNAYLSNLTVLNIKLHSYHWNVTGINFVAIHNYTESMYNEAFESLDAVAELIKMKGEMPLSSLKSYLTHASIEELEGKSLSAKDVLNNLISDLELIKNQALEIRALADEEDDFSTVNLFENQVESYNKHLWFLKTMNL